MISKIKTLPKTFRVKDAWLFGLELLHHNYFLGEILFFPLILFYLKAFNIIAIFAWCLVVLGLVFVQYSFNMRHVLIWGEGVLISFRRKKILALFPIFFLSFLAFLLNFFPVLLTKVFAKILPDFNQNIIFLCFVLFNITMLSLGKVFLRIENLIKIFLIVSTLPFFFLIALKTNALGQVQTLSSQIEILPDFKSLVMGGFFVLSFLTFQGGVNFMSDLVKMKGFGMSQFLPRLRINQFFSKDQEDNHNVESTYLSKMRGVRAKSTSVNKERWQGLYPKLRWSLLLSLLIKLLVMVFFVFLVLPQIANLLEPDFEVFFQDQASILSSQSSLIFAFLFLVIVIQLLLVTGINYQHTVLRNLSFLIGLFFTPKRKKIRITVWYYFLLCVQALLSILFYFLNWTNLNFLIILYLIVANAVFLFNQFFLLYLVDHKLTKYNQPPLVVKKLYLGVLIILSLSYLLSVFFFIF